MRISIFDTSLERQLRIDRDVFQEQTEVSTLGLLGIGGTEGQL
jgi:hypothetical protein